VTIHDLEDTVLHALAGDDRSGEQLPGAGQRLAVNGTRVLDLLAFMVLDQLVPSQRDAIATVVNARCMRSSRP
jgi:hypothetical protein